MNLLMISGDRSLLQGKQGAFWYTLESFRKHWSRIDILVPRGINPKSEIRNTSDPRHPFENVFVHECPTGLLHMPGWIAKKGAELHAINRFNVMTVHDFPPFYTGMGARRLSKKIHVSYVLEVHHIVGEPHAANVTEWFGRVLSRAYFPWAAQHAVAVRTVAKAVRTVLRDWGVADKKLHIVPSFYLDAHVLQPHDVQKKYDVAFCGRIVPNKGLPEVLQAVALVPNATLLVIGDGVELDRCKRLAKTLGIHNHTEFRGWLPTQRDVIAAIQSAKIFIVASKSEGGPRIGLEAMATGMPVITTPVGVMPDVVVSGKNGIITIGTPEDMAVHMQNLLNDSDLRVRMGHEASNIIQQFERETLIEKYAKFLQSFAV